MFKKGLINSESIISKLRKFVVFPIALFLMPDRVLWVIIMGLLAVAAFVLWIYWDKRNGEIKESAKYSGKRPNKLILINHVLITCYVAALFYERWRKFGKFQALAARLHMKTDTLLTLLTVLCIVAIVLLVDRNRIYDRCLQAYRKWILIWEKKLPFGGTWFLIALVVFIEYMQLEYSTLNTFTPAFREGILSILVNMAVILAMNLLLMVFLQNWKRVLVCTGVFFTIWSIANYYVILFHGSPLYVSELANTKAAMNVLSGYSLEISSTVIGLLVLFLIAIDLVTLLPEKKQGFSWLGIPVYAAVFLINIVIVMIYIDRAETAMTWHWKAAVENSGFMVCVVQDVEYQIRPVVSPEGFDPQEKLEVSAESQDAVSTEYPDIILILNETFCDLDDYTSLDADKDYLADFYSIKNAVFGNAVTPSIGGGTNNSEFELLTSYSMFLLRAGAPFNYLDFKKADNSIVRYLENLGYDTTGMHCGGLTNYSRHTAYPEIGFNNVYLGSDMFTYGKNGNRDWLDSDNYHDLIERYDENNEGPQFIYLLTYQNHGGYKTNDDADDIVHVTKDFGDVTSEVNEYLSSLTLSAQAFRDLTDYFLKVERPVIICMVGDHAPSFITKIPSESDRSEKETLIAQRTVPYVIWSNYDIDFSGCSEYVSMTDIVPILLEAADMPLSPFYRQVLALQDKLPVRTSDGLYMDIEGNVGEINEESPYYQEVLDYYCWEYSSLMRTANYRDELFLP